MMNDRSKLVRIVVILVSVIIFVIAAWFVYSHGFVSIKDTSDISTVSYTRLNNNLLATSTPLPVSGGFVSSGNYGVAITKKSGFVSLSQVTVPHFLMSTPEITSQVSPLVDVVARKGTVDVALKNASLIGYELSGGLRPLTTDNIAGDVVDEGFDENLSLLNKPVQISSSSIGGVMQTKTGIQPAIYDLNSSQVFYFPTLTSSLNSIFTRATSNGFSVYDIKNSTVTVYGSSNQSEPAATFSVKTSKNVSKYNNQPTYSYENNVVALLLGKDVISGGDGKEAGGSNEQTVSIHSLDNRFSRSVGLGEAGVINISLSPDAAYLFVQNSQSASIYNVKTGNIQFIIPYSISQFMWSGEGKDFVFTASHSGIFKGSLKTGSAVNIVPYNTVRPTHISFINGGVVYFSGYTTKTDGNSQPDVYRSILSKNSTSDSLSALQNFPYQGENFYIDCLDNVITIQLTRYITADSTVDDTKARQDADKYIRTKVKNLSNYKVNYSYITTDLRVETDG